MIMTMTMMKISLNPKNLLGASPEVFALMAKFFLANGAGREKPSVSPPTFCKVATSHQLGEIQTQFFLGNLNFSGNQSLTAGTTSTIFALPSILSENIYTDLFDHVNKLYCNYTVSLSIKLG